ncbi:MAG TPA: N,N-dimethylformamidase beta subunit family domain-containing protein, partial [Mycobacteriales bacterium]
QAELVIRLQVANGGKPFGDDHDLLTTLSPIGPSRRTTATVRLGLSREARIRLDVVNRNAPGVHAATVEGGTAGTAASARRLVDQRFGRGLHTFSWVPDATVKPGTYSLVLTVTDESGHRTVYGAASPAHPKLLQAPVVRVLGLDAAFEQRSYRAGDVATVVLAADANTIQAQLYQVGHETVPTYANDQLNGVPVGDPVTVDWRGNVNGPASLGLPIGDWPSGVYFVRLQSDDGRLGFAPFVLRPAAPSARVAVVMPTNTWQAYNFYDRDGDGFGDSWYVTWATTAIDLTRPHLLRGVPYRFRSYDLAFLHWLAQSGREPDFYADDDLAAFATGDDLRGAYDLVIFPGHEEYVTGHAYDVVERYRDVGGNLAFLSSNNFFRRVERRGDTLALVGLWRDLGRPEAALLGTEYRASDRGTHQNPFVVTPAGAASWAFAGTGLAAGSSFGRFGIEIDATASSSPPGTQVLAEIPDALGPGLTAQMTYYETVAGARVFSAGVLNFGGEALLWPETSRMLENIWQQLAVA